MSNSNLAEAYKNFEEASADLDRQYKNMPDEELRRISEDINATALEVGKALSKLQERKESRGYDADKTPVDYIK